MSKKTGSRTLPVRWGIVIGLAFTAVVVLLLLWLAGVFEPKISSSPHTTPAVAGRQLDDAVLVPVRLVRVPATEPAVGTIRAVHEAAVASKLLAKIIEINVQAGQIVKKGEILVRLDDQDLAARLKQAEAAVSVAEATRDQARVEFERVDGLFQQDNATKIEWERAQTALETAEAQVVQAQQSQHEAATILAYASIQSPMDGKVVDKLVEAGDTISPGQPLLTLYDHTHMQLVARVRESLTRRLEVGQSIGVEIDALDLACYGRISEIVPEAETASRTFSVKVTGPCPEGVYSGMFGRLLIPLDDEEVLLIPHAAVRRVGQLDLVDVAEEAGRLLRRRVVQLGRAFDDEIEVLAGLRVGEQVALPRTGEDRNDG